jgi:hypothetical protein
MTAISPYETRCHECNVPRQHNGAINHAADCSHASRRRSEWNPEYRRQIEAEEARRKRQEARRHHPSMFGREPAPPYSRRYDMTEDDRYDEHTEGHLP